MAEFLEKSRRDQALRSLSIFDVGLVLLVASAGFKGDDQTWVRVLMPLFAPDPCGARYAPLGDPRPPRAALVALGRRWHRALAASLHPATIEALLARFTAAAATGEDMRQYLIRFGQHMAKHGPELLFTRHSLVSRLAVGTGQLVAVMDIHEVVETWRAVRAVLDGMLGPRPAPPGSALEQALARSRLAKGQAAGDGLAPQHPTVAEQPASAVAEQPASTAGGHSAVAELPVSMATDQPMSMATDQPMSMATDQPMFMATATSLPQPHSGAHGGLDLPDSLLEMAGTLIQQRFTQTALETLGVAFLQERRGVIKGVNAALRSRAEGSPPDAAPPGGPAPGSAGTTADAAKLTARIAGLLEDSAVRTLTLITLLGMLMLEGGELPASAVPAPLRVSMAQLRRSLAHNGADAAGFENLVSRLLLEPARSPLALEAGLRTALPAALAAAGRFPDLAGAVFFEAAEAWWSFGYGNLYRPYLDLALGFLLPESGSEQGGEKGDEQGSEQGREQGREQGSEQGREQGNENGSEIESGGENGGADGIDVVSGSVGEHGSDLVSGSVGEHGSDIARPCDRGTSKNRATPQITFPSHNIAFNANSANAVAEIALFLAMESDIFSAWTVLQRYAALAGPSAVDASSSPVGMAEKLVFILGLILAHDPVTARKHLDAFAYNNDPLDSMPHIFRDALFRLEILLARYQRRAHPAYVLAQRRVRYYVAQARDSRRKRGHYHALAYTALAIRCLLDSPDRKHHVHAAALLDDACVLARKRHLLGLVLELGLLRARACWLGNDPAGCGRELRGVQHLRHAVDSPRLTCEWDLLAHAHRPSGDSLDIARFARCLYTEFDDTLAQKAHGRVLGIKNTSPGLATTVIRRFLVQGRRAGRTLPSLPVELDPAVVAAYRAQTLCTETPPLGASVFIKPPSSPPLPLMSTPAPIQHPHDHSHHQAFDISRITLNATPLAGEELGKRGWPASGSPQRPESKRRSVSFGDLM